MPPSNLRGARVSRMNTQELEAKVERLRTDLNALADHVNTLDGLYAKRRRDDNASLVNVRTALAALIDATKLKPEEQTRLKKCSVKPNGFCRRRRRAAAFTFAAPFRLATGQPVSAGGP